MNLTDSIRTTLIRTGTKAALIAAAALSNINCGDSSGPSNPPTISVQVPPTARDVTPTTVSCHVDGYKNGWFHCDLSEIGTNRIVFHDSAKTVHGSATIQRTMQLLAGNYRLKGYKSNISAQALLTVNRNHRPTLAFLAPPDSVQLQVGDSVAWTYTATDSDGDPISATLREVGGPLIQHGGAAGSGFLHPSLGSHTYRAVVSDGFTSDSADRHVIVSAAPPPAQVFFTGQNGADYQTLTQACTALNTEAPSSLRMLVTYQGGTLIDTSTTNSSIILSRQFAADVYDVLCSLTSANGNDAANGSFSVSANQPPVITTSPSGTITAQVGDTVPFTAIGVDPEQNNPIDISTKVDGVTVASGSPSLSIDLSLPRGTYTLTTDATDVLGATANYSQVLRFLLAPSPTLSITPALAFVQDMGLGQWQQITCGAQDLDNAGVTAYHLSGPGVDQQSAQAINYNTRLAIGSYPFTCEITSSNGKKYTASSNADVQAATPPSATLTYAQPFYTFVAVQNPLRFTKTPGTWGTGTSTLTLDGVVIASTQGQIDTTISPARGTHVLQEIECDDYNNCSPQTNTPFDAVIPLQATNGSVPANTPAGSSVPVTFIIRDTDNIYNLVQSPSGFLDCGDGTGEKPLPLNGPGGTVSGTCTYVTPGTYTIQMGVTQFGSDRHFADGSVNPAATEYRSTITRPHTAQ